MPSLPEGGWPANLCDSVAALLESQGIPSIIWGDLANNLYGIDQVIMNCGFIVPTTHFDDAVRIVEEAGLPSCPCTDLSHCADPKLGNCLPAHFPIPNQTHCLIYLAPSNVLLDIIPLTADHPNPLELSVCRVEQGRFGYQPNARVLDAISTVKLLIYLVARSTPQRDGLALTWKLTLTAYGTLPNMRCLNVDEFGASAVSQVLGEYWAGLRGLRGKSLKRCRLDMQRALDRLEVQAAPAA
ncbi:hypothetical protein BKA62DRAFT_618394 [Auriculariales sp. MPI-PUGE-AT-0066]|nr:hypothetical protein BKA62DRAFT_618394 [Auriculariales sp. MPI-PUGE-AT-0066]